MLVLRDKRGVGVFYCGGVDVGPFDLGEASFKYIVDLGVFRTNIKHREQGRSLRSFSVFEREFMKTPPHSSPNSMLTVSICVSITSAGKLPSVNIKIPQVNETPGFPCLSESSQEESVENRERSVDFQDVDWQF